MQTWGTMEQEGRKQNTHALTRLDRQSAHHDLTCRLTRRVLKQCMTKRNPETQIQAEVITLLPESEDSGGLFQPQIAVPIPRVSDFVELEWSPRICIPNKLPGDTDGVSPDFTICEPQAALKCGSHNG